MLSSFLDTSKHLVITAVTVSSAYCSKGYHRSDDRQCKRIEHIHGSWMSICDVEVSSPSRLDFCRIS
ncbi:hypothetical protein BC629DRAFT_1522957 [Irpex lacteus]|nr:hypothetical protein BC629DRAFT_1522957 [Irpex lacteus]